MSILVGIPKTKPVARGQAGVRFALLAVTACLMTLGVSYGPRQAHAADCSSAPSAGLDWHQCSKRSLILQNSELEGANLSEGDFSMTDLAGSNLAAVNLEKANLARASLAGTKAEKANFSRIEAYRSTFADIEAPGASFVSAEMQRANLSGADLSGANFEKAELGRVNFKKATLSNAKFSLANLSRADFTEAIIDGPVAFDRAFLFLTHIQGVDLSKATGLEQAQIDLACGDADTKLPEGLKASSSWPCDAD